MFSASASGEPKRSTCTEWSITRSTGTSGLIRFGSPPSRFIALRMAARSTTAGTPVKSCSTTRAGLNGTSIGRLARGLPARQAAHVVLGHLIAVAVPQHGFQQHADGIGQRGDARQAGVFQLGQTIDADPAGAGVEGVAGVKGIVHGVSAPSRLRFRNELLPHRAKPQAAILRYSRKPLAYGEFGLCPGCSGQPSYAFTKRPMLPGQPPLRRIALQYNESSAGCQSGCREKPSSRDRPRRDGRPAATRHCEAASGWVWKFRACLRLDVCACGSEYARGPA